MSRHDDDFSFSFKKSGSRDAATATLAEGPDPTAVEEPLPEEELSPSEVRRRKQFRILILADLSGRTNRAVCNPADLAARKVRMVDADNLDQTLAAFKPEIRLPVDEKTVIPLAFAALEDFRPDALLARIPAFAGMLNLRSRLKDRKTFSEAAAAVKKYIAPAPPAAPGEPAPSEHAPASSDAGPSSFEQMLDRPIAPRNAGTADADALIANLVAGYGVPEADPEQGKLVALVEDALSVGLRAVLRHPAFQAVEGAWRSVEFLVSRLNTDEDLKLCLLDVSKDELYADLCGEVPTDETGFHRVLVEHTRAAGAIPFSLVIGDYEFDQTPENVALLAKLAAVMQEAGMPLVAGATAKLPGFASFAAPPDAGQWQPPEDIALWDKLRARKMAEHIGLAAPRFLLRMPYGPKTDAIDAYPFNEIPEAPVIEQYLWANGAFAVALLIGEAFLESGWEGLVPGNDVSGLPCHMAVVDGDQEMTPCAQGYLSDRVGDILHQLGIIPLLSVKNEAAVKVAGIHSIAKNKPLAASWG